jgi:hypothetical protein
MSNKFGIGIGKYQADDFLSGFTVGVLCGICLVILILGISGKLG